MALIHQTLLNKNKEVKVMLVENQKIMVRWNAANRKHYESLGYTFSHKNDTFYVSVEELPKGSHTKIAVKCDYCGLIIYKDYRDYLKQKKAGEGEDCCYSCCVHKRIKTDEKRYGGKSPTCDAAVHQKQMNTLMDRYGVSYPCQNEEIKRKQQNTCLERYGCTTPVLCDEIKAKMIDTVIRKYGGRSCQCSKEVREKTMRTRMENGNFPRSKQEKALVEKLKEIYGETNCIPQYILDRISFDCLLTVNNVSIDVEYDGRYWHQDIHKDIRRDYYTIGKGYKVLRFRSDYNIPTEEQIRYGVEYLINSNHHHLTIDV